MRHLTSLPFLPPPGQQQPLTKSAPANQQFSRLLDALLVLDAEGSCRISDLASRVGLEPIRLRQLLSTFMTAGADLVDADVPLTLSFGTDAGPLGAEEEDDEAQASADVVWLETAGSKSQWLVGELGRRPVMVKDVARALLAASLVLTDPDLADDRRAGVEALVRRLSDGLGASVHAPAGSVAHALQDAIRERRRLRVRYLHPWTGLSTVVELSPCDVRRQRDRLVLDAEVDGTVQVFGVGGLSELVLLDETFELLELPPRDERTPRVPVVVRVPTYSRAESWLVNGWNGTPLGPVGDGQQDVRVDLDGDLADPAVAQRLGVLLLQLGPGCAVQSPPELQNAAVRVAARLLERHAT